MRPIGSELYAGLHIVQNGVYASGPMRFTTDRVNAAVRPATLSHRVEPLIHLLLVKVDRLGFTVCARHVESFRQEQMNPGPKRLTPLKLITAFSAAKTLT
jgi:hypothetical protein